jgi:hypothetical protein
MLLYSILFGMISSYGHLLLSLVDPWCYACTTTLCLEVVLTLSREEHPVLWTASSSSHRTINQSSLLYS